MRNRIAEYSANGHSIPSNTRDSRVEGLVDETQPAIERLQAAIENTIRRRPLASLVVGAIAGVMLGCLTKRR